VQLDMAMVSKLKRMGSLHAIIEDALAQDCVDTTRIEQIIAQAMQEKCSHPALSVLVRKHDTLVAEDTTKGAFTKSSRLMPLRGQRRGSVLVTSNILDLNTTPANLVYGQRRAALAPNLLSGDELERLLDEMTDTLRSGHGDAHKQSRALVWSRFLISIAVSAGLLFYELGFFEWRDWLDSGEPAAVTGFTGATVLWALSLLWCLSQVFDSGLTVFSVAYRGFSHKQQVKIVKYCVQLSWGSVLAVSYMVVQLHVDGFIESDCDGGATIAQSLATSNNSDIVQPYDVAVTNGLCLARWSWSWSHILALFGVMYMWEIVHEGYLIHASLALHHFCILLMVYLGLSFYPTREWISLPAVKAMADSGFPQLFAAGLEQPTFVALLLHRFGASPNARTIAFQFAWVSFGVTKLAALILSLYILPQTWESAPMGCNIVLLIILVIVASTQLYSTLVLRSLATRMSMGRKQQEIHNTLRVVQRQLSADNVVDDEPQSICQDIEAQFKITPAVVPQSTKSVPVVTSTLRKVLEETEFGNGVVTKLVQGDDPPAQAKIISVLRRTRSPQVSMDSTARGSSKTSQWFCSEDESQYDLDGNRLGNQVTDDKNGDASSPDSSPDKPDPNDSKTTNKTNF
jgi:hypothetical protein